MTSENVLARLSALDSHTPLVGVAVIAGYVRDLSAGAPALAPEQVKAAAEAVGRKWRLFAGRAEWVEEDERWAIRVPTGALPAEHNSAAVTSTQYNEPCPLPAVATSPTSAAFLPPTPGPYFVHPSAPLTMDLLAARSAPLLSIHVTTFSDRQFVGIAFPHAVVDAKGMGAYVRALAAELLRETTDSSGYDLRKLGEEVYDVAEVQEASRFDEAVKRVARETATEVDAEPSRACQEGGIGWGATPPAAKNLAKYVKWQTSEWLWHKAEEGGVFLGRELVKLAVDQAKADVADATAGDEWVSTEDVLWAWLLKAAYANEPGHRQVRDATAICCRNLFGLVAPLYPHNSVLLVASPDVPSPHATSLADLALFRRRRLHAVRTPAKAAALVRWSESFWPGRMPMWQAPEHDSWLATSHVASMLGTALDLGDGAGAEYVCTARPRGSQSAIVTSEGKDGYTLRGRMSRSRWVSVRAEVAKLQAAYEAQLGDSDSGFEEDFAAVKGN